MIGGLTDCRIPGSGFGCLNIYEMRMVGMNYPADDLSQLTVFSLVSILLRRPQQCRRLSQVQHFAFSYIHLSSNSNPEPLCRTRFSDESNAPIAIRSPFSAQILTFWPSSSSVSGKSRRQTVQSFRHTFFAQYYFLQMLDRRRHRQQACERILGSFRCSSVTAVDPNRPARSLHSSARCALGPSSRPISSASVRMYVPAEQTNLKTEMKSVGFIRLGQTILIDLKV